MKGISQFVGNLLLWVLIVVSIILGIYIFLSSPPTVQHQCIAIQSAYITDLRYALEEADKKNIISPDFIPFSFKVLDCVKCIWYDTNDEQLVVVYSVRKGFLKSEDLMEVPYNLSTRFLGIGCDCDRLKEKGCKDESGDVYCANIRNDEYSPYSFEVDKYHVKCVNCPDTSKPCMGISSYACQNAHDHDLCDGLDIAYGTGYREACCNNLGLCC